MKSLDEWEVPKESVPGGEKKRVEVFNKCKDIVEEEQLDPYPFKYLKLIETPSFFLRGSLFSDNAQLEIAFFEERFATINQDKPGTLPEGLSKNRSVWEYMLYQGMPFYLSQINIDRIFTGYNRSVTSERCRGMGLIYK